jgi:iron complex outermembrane recepter protein
MTQGTRGGFRTKMLLQLAGALALTSAAVDAASAQETNSQAESAAGQVDEIIVTARKREESSLDIPVTVTAFTQEAIQNNNLTSIERVAAMTPQLQVNRQPSGSGATLSMRGIGSTSTSSGIEQSVALVIDGVYYGSGRMLNEGMFDMRQIEILEGPQALFFGKNATGGVLSFATNEPGEEFEGYVRTGYEFTAQGRTIDGVISGPVSDSVGLRLAVHLGGMDEGYFENRGTAGTGFWFDFPTFTVNAHPYGAPRQWAPGGQDAMARFTARFEPNDAFNSTLRINYADSLTDNTTTNVIPVRCPVGGVQQGGGPAALPCGEDWVSQGNDLPPDVAAVNPHFYNRHGGHSYNDFEDIGATWTTNLDLGNLSFSNVANLYNQTNIFFGDADTTNVNSLYAAVENGKSAFSNEFRVQSTFDTPLNFMAGFYYQSQEDTVLNNSSLGVSNSALVGTAQAYLQYAGWENVSQTDGETWAVFGQALFDISPTVEVAAGARYTHETKDSFFRMVYVHPLLQAGFVQYNPLNPGPTQLAAEQSFNDLSPEVTITWQPNADLTLYAAYKEAFKSGGFSNSSLFQVTTVVSDLAFRPETASGFEAGVKAFLFDRSLRVNLVGFSYEYADMQIDFLDLGRTAFTTFNAGSAETQGLELQAIWRPTEQLTLGGNLNYIKAEYASFDFAPCYPGQALEQGCLNGLTPTSPIPRDFQNLTGRAPALAPEWSAAFSADYNVPMGGSLNLDLSANLRYMGAFNTYAFGGESFATQDASTTLDAAAHLSNDDDTWQLSLIGKNLTEEFIALGGTGVGGANTGESLTNPNPALVPVQPDFVAFPNFPRTVEVQLTLRF